MKEKEKEEEQEENLDFQLVHHKLGVAGASSEHGDGLKHHLVEEQSHRFVPQILSTRILLLLSGKAFGWLEPLAADGVLCWKGYCS